MTGLVYLHGFASGPSSTKAQYFRRRFEEMGIDMAIPDLAEGDFERLTLTGQLAVIERVAAGGSVSLIGSSMGGYLAALYAARHPEVRRVVLLAPAFRFAHRWAESLGEQTMAEWHAAGKLPMFHYGDGRTRELGYGLYEDGLRYEDYPDVRQPVLIFHGAQDDTVPPVYSSEFASARANVDLRIVDSGHELIDVLDALWPPIAVFLTAR